MSSEKCKKCIYRIYLEGMYICNYIDVVGISRGCPPGDKCTKYVEGNRKKGKQEKDLGNMIWRKI